MTMAWYRREHAQLVGGVFHSQKDATHVCWKSAASTVVDFLDAWAAWLQIAVIGRGGCHDYCQNASYVVILTGFFPGFGPWTKYLGIC